MQSFICNSCGLDLFFENYLCVRCNHPLGFATDRMSIIALQPVPYGNELQPVGSNEDRHYRLCSNAFPHRVCNWLVPAEDDNPFCQACRLNELIPDLRIHENVARWQKLEVAKRRCLYTLFRLGLGVDAIPETNCPPLRFSFCANAAEGSHVMTGHSSGLITIDILEADEDECERRRLRLHEPYRTLIGHFRHETGHYYWTRLVATSPHLTRFRELFGDERSDYAAALESYYAQGPAADWSTRTITAYASSHPWEDFAETWAHYLHLVDTLETAVILGVGTPGADQPEVGQPPFDLKAGAPIAFARLMEKWVPLTSTLNAINRAMGVPDLYPFIIPALAVEKLRFVHELVAASNVGVASEEAGRQLALQPMLAIL